MGGWECKMDKAVVITGIGILSPIGIGRASFWEALAQGKTGFKQTSLFDTSRLNVHVAGEIEFDPVQFLGKKGLRDLDRSTKLVNSAAKLAIDESKLEITEANSPRMRSEERRVGKECRSRWS